MIARIEKGRKVTPSRLHRVNPGSYETIFFNLLANMGAYRADVPKHPPDLWPCPWSHVSWQVISSKICTDICGSWHRGKAWFHLAAFYVVRKKENKSSRYSPAVVFQGRQIWRWEGSVRDSDTGLKASV